MLKLPTYKKAGKTYCSLTISFLRINSPPRRQGTLEGTTFSFLHLCIDVVFGVFAWIRISVNFCKLILFIFYIKFKTNSLFGSNFFKKIKIEINSKNISDFFLTSGSQWCLEYLGAWWRNSWGTMNPNLIFLSSRERRRFSNMLLVKRGNGSTGETGFVLNKVTSRADM